MQAKRDVLTRALAQSRVKSISDVEYDIWLVLKKSKKEYEGTCQITFNFDKDGSSKDDLILDFIGKVIGLKINDKKGEGDNTYSNIALPSKLLKNGKNIVEIKYQNKYDKTGEGLHHFRDTEDGKDYLYTHLEPYSAHRVFPCFDQPDLKAKFRLKVSAPKEWKVISNTSEVSERTSGASKDIVFKHTPRISTYLFHISAGDYAQFENTFDGKNQKIPLRIFCRQSQIKYIRKNVNVERMFEYTKQGLRFYSGYFDFQYPFEKYDQIFVPEFNSGAMENVGAVTFSEGLLFQHEPTRTELLRLADIILHEMVHMWFGNLVTMKWWDDLWLNESFADYLSYYGLTKATEFGNEGWQSFYSRKAWAYVEDQMRTTHPIAADAPDTDVAMINFDGISYAKGAAVLKQLMYHLGEEKFRDGIRHYFKQHQWGNTELKDFISAMEKASGKSLKSWADSWISTTGVNLTRTECSLKDKKINGLSIIQQSNNSKIKSHETKVALIYENDGKCEVEKEINVQYNFAKTRIREADNLPEPKIIFTNYQDYDYAQAFLDDKSLRYAISNINKVKDNLTRQMLLGSIWQMIRNAEVNPREYLRLALANSLNEEDLTILESHIRRVGSILGKYLTDKEYKDYAEKFHKLGWEGLKKAPRARKNIWFSTVIMTAGGIESPEGLVDLLNGKTEIKDFDFNQEKRWAIILVLMARGYKDADKMLKAEEKGDKSDNGKKSAFEARVASVKDKKKYWKMFVEGKEYSLDYLREGMGGFYWISQKKELRAYQDLFFKEIRKIFSNKERQYAVTFFSRLYPSLFTEHKTLDDAQKILKEKDISEILKKALLQEVDEMERNLRIIDKYSS